jgi:hypothetical protein
MPNAPIYLVKERSLIGNTIYEAGEKAEYDGLPSDNLEPTCDEGRARAEQYRLSNEERVKAMITANTESAVGDTVAFMNAFKKEMLASQEATANAIKEGIAEALAAIFPHAPPAEAVDGQSAPDPDPVDGYTVTPKVRRTKAADPLPVPGEAPAAPTAPAAETPASA